jgi:NADPH2:quinone reductase
MRAIIQEAVGGPEVLRLREIEDPVPGLGGLLIRTTAIGVNFHDVEIRRHGEAGTHIPGVLGTDVAGTVCAIGPGVTGFSVGDRVVALARQGGYAELTVVSARLTAPLPDVVADGLAVSAPTAGLSAWFLLKEFVGSGAESLVTYAAAGGVGHWLGSMLRNRPIRAVGIVSSPEKAELAWKAGYDAVLNRLAEADLVQAVRNATGRGGADVVLDTVAGPRFRDSFRMLRPGGTVILFGKAGGEPSLDEIKEVFQGAKRNLGLRTWFLSRSLSAQMAGVRAGLDELLAMLVAGEVSIPVQDFPLAAAAEAHRLMEAGRTAGKVVLRP